MPFLSPHNCVGLAHLHAASKDGNREAAPEDLAAVEALLMERLGADESALTTGRSREADSSAPTDQSAGTQPTNENAPVASALPEEADGHRV